MKISRGDKICPSPSKTITSRKTKVVGIDTNPSKLQEVDFNPAGIGGVRESMNDP